MGSGKWQFFFPRSCLDWLCGGFFKNRTISQANWKKDKWIPTYFNLCLQLKLNNWLAHSQTSDCFSDLNVSG